MLQKDGFFRRREEGQFRHNQNQPMNPAPSTAANPAAPAPTEPVATRAEPRPAADERKEAKLVVGPQIKIKGVEISDCDTLVVEGRIEATLDSRVLEITEQALARNVTDKFRRVRDVRELGVLFAIDEFGSRSATLSSEYETRSMT